MPQPAGFFDPALRQEGWWGEDLIIEGWYEEEFIPSVTAGQTITVEQAFETDLAQAIAWAPKNRLVAQATETDLAQAIAVNKTVAIGQVLEADLAQGITAGKTAAVGQATETDLAQAIGHAKTKAVGQTFETDLAQPVSWSPKHRLVSQAFEFDQAFTITGILGGGPPPVVVPPPEAEPADAVMMGRRRRRTEPFGAPVDLRAILADMQAKLTPSRGALAEPEQELDDEDEELTLWL